MDITIGMPAFKDAVGVDLTVSCLRHYHRPELLERIQLLVVDNSPEFKPGQNGQAAAAGETAEYLHTLSSCSEFRSWKVIPQSSPQGTALAKDRVFREADGDLVICCDSHVEFLPGAIDAVVKWFEDRPDFDGLVQGPLKFNPPGKFATHFSDVWSSEMWGQWSEAFKCGCCPDGVVFGTQHMGNEVLRYHDPACPSETLGVCNFCGRKLPLLPWSGHETSLAALGYVRMIDTEEAFPIWATGGWVYACRRDAWLGFNPYFNGFGGEEVYIQEKFRKAGKQVLCLPQFKSWHRFLKPCGGATRYPLMLWDKARNYVIGLQEVGLPLDRARKHFCEEIAEGSRFAPAEWDSLVKNPITAKPMTKEAKAGCKTGCGGSIVSTGNTIAELFDWVKANPRDLDLHADVLAAVARRADGVVTEITKRRESTMAFAFGGAKEIVSYQLDQDKRAVDVIVAGGVPVRMFGSHGLPAEGIEPTDVLFIDSKHTHEAALAQLLLCGPVVRKFIILHDTVIHGEIGQDGRRPGLLGAVRDFVRGNSEWTVVYHTAVQYGLTILSRLPEDKQRLPGVFKQAWNFSKAVAESAAKGFPVADEATINRRLDTCSLCPQQADGRCAVCGCFLAESLVAGMPAKAPMAGAECPLGYWAEADRAGGPIVPPSKPDWL